MISAVVARRIRLVGFDVDGVMTDGGLYIGDVDGAPLEFKRYNAQDGVGIHLLRKAGIKVAIVTGRVSESVRLRAKDLHVDDLVQDKRARKLGAMQRILRRHGITPEAAAFVGDDLPDLAVMRLVGLPVAVRNSTPEVRSVAKVRLVADGGHGAVREFAQLLLSARGEWDALVEEYLAERSGAVRKRA